MTCLITMDTKVEKNTATKMQLNILAFGIAKDIVGGSLISFDIQEGASVGMLKKALLSQFPRFGNLVSLAIGVNEEYAKDDVVLKATDEIVIIPPVSGG